MTEFEPIEEALNEDAPLVLPAKGRDGKTRKYTIKPASGEAWLRLAALGQVGQALGEDRMPAAGDLQVVLETSQEQMLRDYVGDNTAERLIKDGVSTKMMHRIMETAMAFHMNGVEDAQAVWLGKDRNSKTPKDKDGGEATASTASTSGTSTPRKSNKQ